MNDRWNDQYDLLRLPPKVGIGYEVEIYGAQKRVELPFVIGVLADLSGKRTDPLEPVSDRKLLEFDVDNIDARMRSASPRVAFKVPNALSGEGDMIIDITFETLDDFLPTGVALKSEALRRLLDERTSLSGLIGYLDGKLEAQELVERAMSDAQLLQQLSVVPESNGAGETQEPTAIGVQAVEAIEYLQSLHSTLRLRSDLGDKTVASAIRTMAYWTLREPSLRYATSVATIEAMIARIDLGLSNQINLILHHDDFQALESTWRGLAYLVRNIETDGTLKIRVMNISKRDLHKTLKRFKGSAWNQSPIFKRLVEDEYGQFGGETYACVVGDYYFDHSPPDIELLTEMSKVCASGNMVFLAGASPYLFQMDSWLELTNPRDLSKIFSTAEYADWRSLRESEDARYVGLTLPNLLARRPYGANAEPVVEFAFEEETQGGDVRRLAWMNAAYVVAFNAGRAFRLYGWCAHICGYETGGAIENLPLYSFPDDMGGVTSVCPTLVNISERREAEVAGLGLCAMVHRKGTDFAAFMSTPSLHTPLVYDDPDATWGAKRAADLAFVLTTGQFLRAIRCMKRDKTGTFKDSQDCEVMINRWLNDFVEPSRLVSPIERARRPLLGAEVKFYEQDEGQSMKVFLMPYHQLERLYSGIPNTITLRIRFSTESIGSFASE